MKSRLYRIGDAGPKGKGIFANRFIPASMVVASYSSKPRWIWDIPQNLWPYTFQVGYDLYKTPRRNSAGWLINHSCDPNCVVSGDSIIAERGIREGEELTFDYSTDVDWEGFSMKCRCGTPICRGTVRAYRYLPARLKIRYGERVAAFIAREYISTGLKQVT